MDARLQIVAIVGAVGLLVLVLELVRRRALMERYALLWLASSLVILVLAVWSDALTVLARQLGILSAPNALFFVALGFVLFLLLHFSAAMSRLTDQSKVLAQRQAILEQRLSEVERERALARGEEPRQLEPLLRSDR
jgi:hypothetical protein